MNGTMTTVIVRKRYGEETDVRDFVRPQDVMVRQLVGELQAKRSPLSGRACWEWVVQNIRYPPGPAAIGDSHTELRYHQPFPLWPLPAFVSRVDDFWNFPAETLRDRMGDCDDRCGLLTSMLLHVPDTSPWFTVGYFDGGHGRYGHTWVSMPRGGRWVVLETTVDRLPPAQVEIYESGPYVPLFRFNHVAVQVIAGVDVPASVHHPAKAATIAGVYRVVTSPT